MLLDVGTVVFAHISLLIVSRERPIPSLAQYLATILFCIRAVYVVEGLLNFDLAHIRLLCSIACTFALHVVQALLAFSLLSSKREDV